MMCEIVLGIGASHTTLMNTHWDKVDHLSRAHTYRDGLAAAASALREQRPDAVIVIGSNHFRGFWLDLMPAFTIGVDEVISAGEHGTPKGPLPSHPILAQHVCNELIRRDFDVAFSTRLTVDHGISHAYQWLVQGSAAPIIPIVINCFAPPLPSLRRARQLGVALGAILRANPDRKRVAIIATGGLSHALPFPDWRAPQSEDDKFLADSWRDGRGRFQEFEVRRREIVVNFPARINETFDRCLLDRVEAGRMGEFIEALDEDELVRAGGNGANEIRNWIAMTAALHDFPGCILAYSSMPEWLTGMAVALIRPDSNTPTHTGDLQA
jgi:2,3-dihydroxyphenylpropionate 1,2-dioxygenase